MSKMVTRCPQCQTSFRVTDEHLKIANGAVRCGSCLHVFQAKDHRVPDMPPAATSHTAASRAATTTTQRPAASASSIKSPPTPASAPASPTTSGKFQFDQSSIDNASSKGKFSFDQKAIDSGSAAKLLDEPDKRIPETVLTKAHQPKKKEIGDDELISDDMDVDGEPDASPAVSAKPQAAAPVSIDTLFGGEDDDYDDVFDDVANQSGDENADIDFEALINGDIEFDDVENATDESLPEEDDAWASHLLDTLKEDPSNPEDKDEAAVSSQSYINPVDADVARHDLGLDEDAPFAMSESIIRSAKDSMTEAHNDNSATESESSRRAQRPPLFSTPEDVLLPIASPRAEMLAQIKPGPVELLQQSSEDKQKRKERLLEMSVCAGLIMLMVVQGVFFNFHQLARQDSTRPLMGALCSVFPCKLPPSQRWRNIKVSNLVVRADSTIPNVLVVDAIITNRSPHEMPFPKLELYFNDLDQLPVASRRFEPSEYLAGEMTGLTIMPVNQPIHIAIQVINPGEKAVNWRMNVTPFE